MRPAGKASSFPRRLGGHVARHPWWVGGLAVGLLALTAALAWVSRGAPWIPADEPWDGRFTWALISIPVPVVGALIAARRPGNPYGWVWLAMGLGLAVQSAASEYVIMAISGEALPFMSGAALLAGVGWVAAFFSVPLVLLLFPTGHLPSPRWRPLLSVIGGGIAVAIFVGMFMPGDGVTPIESPLAVGGGAGQVIVAVVGLATVAVLVSSLPAAVSLYIRYRTGTPVERQQLKWFSFAAVVFVLVLALDWVWELEGVWESLKEGLPLVLLPVAIAIAILKHRLYDIDRLVSRTVAYAMVSTMLIAIYLSVVFVWQRLLPAESDIAVAASTLAAAAAFNPLRRRVQAAVDRRFNRSGFDAVRTVEAFSQQLRGASDVGQLTSQLERVTASVMEPEHLSVWVGNRS